MAPTCHRRSAVASATLPRCGAAAGGAAKFGDFTEANQRGSPQLAGSLTTRKENHVTTHRSDGEVLQISPKDYARRWKTLAMLALSLLIIGLDNTILNVALPSLQEEFDASSSTLQWIVDSYLLVFAGLLLTMGTIGDRFGRKRALQLGLLLFGGASLAVLVVDTANQLIAVRAAMGVGGALIMPATLSIITNVFPKEERGKAIGIWAAMGAVGIGLGPLGGGLLLEWFDWTAVFLVNVPVAAIALAAGAVLVPNSRDPEPGAFDFAGALLSITTLVTLVYGIIEAPERGWTDPLVLASFGVAAALAVGFVRWERRTASPMLNLSYFRNPRFSVASAGLGFASFALFGAIFAMTQYLQDAHGYSALEAGGAMVPLAFGLMMGAGSSHKLVPKVGPAKVMVAGLVGLGTMLSLTLMWTPDMAYWPIGLWFFGVALSMGWILGTATASVMGSVPEEKSGVASAMNDVTRQVGGALGTAVIGSLIASIYSSKIADSVETLPEEQRGVAGDSVGQANAVAETLPAADGANLVDEAGRAFTDALGFGFGAAAVVAVLGAVAVRRWLPARPQRDDTDVVDLPQAA
jgi:MFS transporter, DHA2 family, multidrug resistance protein